MGLWIGGMSTIPNSIDRVRVNLKDRVKVTNRVRLCLMSGVERAEKKRNRDTKWRNTHRQQRVLHNSWKCRMKRDGRDLDWDPVVMIKKKMINQNIAGNTMGPYSW